MKQHKTILEARVAARNEVNAEVNRLAPILLANFSPLVGQKIMKQTGLMEKFKDLVPATTTHHMYRLQSDYSLAFVVKSTAGTVDGGCVYEEEEAVYIGELRGGLFLDKMCNFQLRRTDYTVEGVIQIRKEVSAAEEALSKLSSGLHPFGKYDR